MFILETLDIGHLDILDTGYPKSGSQESTHGVRVEFSLGSPRFV